MTWRGDEGQRVTSFISEHSVEFVIIPRAVTALRERFGQVVALYFWKSREGNALASALSHELSARILAVFPRRPKLSNVHGDEYLYGKINSSLFEFAEKSVNFGIPVIAGVPIVRGMKDLAAEPAITWFHLSPTLRADLSFRVNVETNHVSLTHPTDAGFVSLVSERALSNVIDTESAPLAWNRAVEAMSELRVLNENQRYSLRLFGGGIQYKPVYLVAFQCDDIEHLIK